MSYRKKREFAQNPKVSFLEMSNNLKHKSKQLFFTCAMRMMKDVHKPKLNTNDNDGPNKGNIKSE